MSNTLFGLRQTISKSSLCGELKSFDPWREVAPSLEETKEIGPEGALLWPALPRADAGVRGSLSSVVTCSHSE